MALKVKIFFKKKLPLKEEAIASAPCLKYLKIYFKTGVEAIFPPETLFINY
jgi:hypothetical protein